MQERKRGMQPMPDTIFLTTKEVAQLLDVHEKMVYALVAEKGLPASKVTGKWLFPRHLVEQWVERHIPRTADVLPAAAPHGLLVLAGSHDLLLHQVLNLFNRRSPEHLAVFANVGSLRGIQALRQGMCHIASSHLLQRDDVEYNFEFLDRELGGEVAAVVNFCRREQGLLLAPGNPRQIRCMVDLGIAGLRVANRPEGTGTRLLFDRELAKVGLAGTELDGYDREFSSHFDVGVEVLMKRADAAPGIKAVANTLGLDFLPLRWERYDLLIAKRRFFEPDIQDFLNLLHDPDIHAAAERIGGYDVGACGHMIFSQPGHEPDSA